MVLKRQLPSRISKNTPQKEATSSVQNTEENQLITDFEVTPESSQKSTPKTDPFTADALKEAADALAKEMNSETPSKSDLYLDDPFSETTEPSLNQEATKEESSLTPKQKSEPMPDVFADIDDTTPFQPKSESQPDLKPDFSNPQVAKTQSSTVQEQVNQSNDSKETSSQTASSPSDSINDDDVKNNPMRRKVRNKRKRAKYVPSDQGNQGENTPPQTETVTTSSSSKAQPEDSFEGSKGPDVPDMEIAPDHTRDATQDVDRAFKEIEGIEHPADQEIEAAYMPPAEISEEEVTSTNKPHIDLSQLETDKKPTTPKGSEIKGTTTPSITVEESTPFELPQNFESISVPEIQKEKNKKSQDVRAQDLPITDSTATQNTQKDSKTVEKAPKELPTAPDLSNFSAPSSFADIAESDKKSAPLPWEESIQPSENKDKNDGWEFTAGAAFTPASDIYAETPPQPATEQQEPIEIKEKKTEISLPFLSSQPKNKQSAPELPNSDAAAISSTKKPSALKAVGTLGILILIGFVGFKLITGKDKTQETVARFTGALTENTENLPKNMGGAQDIENKNLIQPEKIISNAELNRLNQELEEDLALLDPPKAPEQPKASINFVDVTKEEASKPIVATPDEEIPGEKGFVASLQDAIKKERGKNTPSTTTTTDETEANTAPTKDRFIESKLLQQQVEEELAAYRKALSEANTELPIKPDEFFGTVNENGVLLDRPIQKTAEPEVFTENPYNLPVIAEPTTEPEPTVRTLDEFDVAMFEPPKPKVRIPKGLKPRLRASDFPEMTVLSLIPNKGLIAHINDREGVLLIGEMLEGWELYAVTTEHAEFRSGERKFYVNIN